MRAPWPTEPSAEHPGFEYVWLPDERLRWQALGPADASKACRYAVGPNRQSCKQPSVARLDRSTRRDRQLWWHYCAEHLFGRRLHDGVLYHRVLREVGE